MDPILSKVYNQEMSSSENVKLAAVILEGRNLPGLQEAIDNHLKHLPEGTHLIWHTSEQAWKSQDAPGSYVIPARLGVAGYTQIRNDLNSIADYNRILTSPAFWESLQAYDRVLIFQEDSRLLRTGIEEFYPYSYVGAEWAWCKDRTPVGNGGLSLRDPKIMLEVCQRFGWDGFTNEDDWITRHMYQQEIGTIAPVEVARRFSVEACYALGSMGYHAISRWLTPEQCAAILAQYQTHIIS